MTYNQDQSPIQNEKNKTELNHSISFANKILLNAAGKWNHRPQIFVVMQPYRKGLHTRILDPGNLSLPIDRMPWLCNFLSIVLAEILFVQEEQYKEPKRFFSCLSID
jgi:hypothetical protein